MKKNLIYFLVLLLFPAVLAACSEDDLSSTSVIQPPQVVQNDFDRWLDRHYLAPYNIEFQYRYTDIESSMGYYLTPADYNQSIALAKLVIALCLEPYDEVTGSRDFIRARRSSSSPVRRPTRATARSSSARRKEARRSRSSMWMPCK